LNRADLRGGEGLSVVKKSMDISEAIEQIDQGNNAWKETDEVVDIEVKKPLKKVILSPLPLRERIKVRGISRKSHPPLASPIEGGE
jgi:hypothetical protein